MPRIFYKRKKSVPSLIEVISGQKKRAKFIKGVAHTNHKPVTLSGYIGGGSTEIYHWRMAWSKILRSLQMGCVSYTNKFFKQGEIKAKSYLIKAIPVPRQELEIW